MMTHPQHHHTPLRQQYPPLSVVTIDHHHCPAAATTTKMTPAEHSAPLVTTTPDPHTAHNRGTTLVRIRLLMYHPNTHEFCAHPMVHIRSNDASDSNIPAPGDDDDDHDATHDQQQVENRTNETSEGDPSTDLTREDQTEDIHDVNERPVIEVIVADTVSSSSTPCSDVSIGLDQLSQRQASIDTLPSASEVCGSDHCCILSPSGIECTGERDGRMAREDYRPWTPQVLTRNDESNKEDSSSQELSTAIPEPSQSWWDAYYRWNTFHTVHPTGLKGHPSFETTEELHAFNDQGEKLTRELRHEMQMAMSCPAGEDDPAMTVLVEPYQRLLSNVRLGDSLCMWWHIMDVNYGYVVPIQRLPVSDELKSRLMFWRRRTSLDWVDQAHQLSFREEGQDLEQHLLWELNVRPTEIPTCLGDCPEDSSISANQLIAGEKQPVATDATTTVNLRCKQATRAHCFALQTMESAESLEVS